MYKYFSYLYIINYYLKYYLLPICSEPTYSSYFLLPPLDSYIAKQLKVCILMLMLYERMKSFEEKIVIVIVIVILSVRERERERVESNG